MEVRGLRHRGQDVSSVLLVGAHHQDWAVAIRDCLDDNQILRTGKVLHDCSPDNTHDAELEKDLPSPTDIRVELTLKKAPEMFRRLNSDVAEVFSPPRIAQEAGLRKYGGKVLRPGWSLDLTMREQGTGKAWDFSKEEMRKKAMKLARESKPFLVIGSPPCTAFSKLQNLNANRKPQ